MTARAMPCDLQHSMDSALKQALSSRFDQYANKYDKHSVVQKAVASHALRILSTKLKKANTKGVLIDLGCGTSNYLNDLSQFAYSTIGIDVSQNMLRQSCAKALTLEHDKAYFINADAEQLPLSTASISTVFSSMAMQWCVAPAQVMTELNRVLKPQGLGTLAILLDKSFASLHAAYQTLGMESRLNTFYSADKWLESANKHDWSITHEVKTFSTQHNSVLEMLRSIKNVGAGTKQTICTDNAEAAKPALGISRKELSALTYILNQPRSRGGQPKVFANTIDALHAKTQEQNVNDKPTKFSLNYVVLFLSLTKHNKE